MVEKDEQKEIDRHREGQIKKEIERKYGKERKIGREKDDSYRKISRKVEGPDKKDLGLAPRAGTTTIAKFSIPSSPRQRTLDGNESVTAFDVLKLMTVTETSFERFTIEREIGVTFCMRIYPNLKK